MSAFTILEGAKKAMPTISMECFKDNQLIESIDLEHKAVFIFGRNP